MFEASPVLETEPRSDNLPREYGRYLLTQLPAPVRETWASVDTEQDRVRAPGARGKEMADPASNTHRSALRHD
jgi:hypothetical protein